MEFEWDERKRQSNIRRHAIDFLDVPAIFEGLTLTVEDTRSAYNETRYVTIGLLKGRTIVVAHTERAERICFISARKATKYEEISYYQEITNKLGAPRRAKRKGN